MNKPSHIPTLQEAMEFEIYDALRHLPFLGDAKVVDKIYKVFTGALSVAGNELIGKYEDTGLPVTQAQEQVCYDKRIRNEFRADQHQKLDELLK